MEDNKTNKRLRMNKRETRFFRVWRNEVILNTIFYHSRCLRINEKGHLSIDGLINFKVEYKNYLSLLYLEDNQQDPQLQDPQLKQPQLQDPQLQQLQQPPQLLQQQVPQTQPPLPVNLIPESVTILYVKTSIQLKKKDLPSNIKRISFGKKSNPLINLDCIPLGIEVMKCSLKSSFISNTPLPLPLPLPDQPIQPQPTQTQTQQPFIALKKLVIGSESQSLLQHPHLFPNLSTVVIRRLNDPKLVTIPSSVTSLFFTNEYNNHYH